MDKKFPIITIVVPGILIGLLISNIIMLFLPVESSSLKHIANLLTQENNIINSNHVVQPPFWIVDIKKQRDFIRKQLTDPSDRRKYDEIQKKIDKIQKHKWLIIVSRYTNTFLISLLLVTIAYCFMPQSMPTKLIEKLSSMLPSFYIHRWIDSDLKFLWRIFGVIGLLIFLWLEFWPTWTWIDLYYPHDKYGSEVDAAFITTFGSTFTLGLTLIITAYFNRQTQKAMLEQSRANLKEKVIETRLKFYPQLEKSLRTIAELFPEQVKDQKWTEEINGLKQLFDDKKYYMSKELREKVQDLLRLVHNALDNLRSIPYGSEQLRNLQSSYKRTLDQLIKKCLEDIEKSMDLSSLVDLD